MPAPTSLSPAFLNQNSLSSLNPSKTNWNDLKNQKEAAESVRSFLQLLDSSCNDLKQEIETHIQTNGIVSFLQSQSLKTSFTLENVKNAYQPMRPAIKPVFLQNTCHFSTFLGLFSANQTAKDRAQQAINTGVSPADAQKSVKDKAKVLLDAILKNDLKAYSTAFHNYKNEIQHHDVRLGQQASPSSSLELANGAYQQLVGRQDVNLFGEIEESMPSGPQVLNAVIQLNVPTRDQSVLDLFKSSAITGGSASPLAITYTQKDDSKHIILSIPRVYMEASLPKKNTSSITMDWNSIQIDGQAYRPVAIGVHYGATASSGHHECYKSGTPITDAMKKGLEYVVLEKTS